MKLLRRETLSNDAVEVDWVTLNPTVETAKSPISTHPTAPALGSIVEAQGWVIGANGEVILTARAPNLTYSFLHHPVACAAPQSTPRH